MKHAGKALRHFILGLLLYTILLNLAAFISPFWGEYILRDERGIRSRELLNFAEAVLSLFSFFYLSSLWHLGQVAESRFLRSLLPTLGVWVVFFALCKAWSPADWVSSHWAVLNDILLGVGQLAGLLSGSLVVLQIFRSTEIRSLAEPVNAEDAGGASDR